ncbi:hypothetical protein ID866_3939 [Astraeus odoratus]|nr:hypothetical protein ID866_3939 [Astraeus odoratus]
MGNTGSSSGRPHNDDTVDYGYLTPQGVYTGPRDWNQSVVTKLIIDRKLAPFYRPLEEYSEDWDDEQILAARRDPPDADSSHVDPSTRPDFRESARAAHPTKRSGNLKEPSRIPEAALYRGAVECPICFLNSISAGPSSAQKRRRKSFGHDSPEVVTTDQIRPDWETKLAAVRAAVARRANRRIVMRQVGDRLIPVGVTSGRVHTLPGTDGTDNGESETGSGTGSRRRRGGRTNGPADITQLLGQIGLGGQDLEELMVMEAMRLSLLEHEEHQRREEEKRRKEAATAQVTTAPSAESGASVGPSTVSATAQSSGTTTAQGGDSSDGPIPRSRSLTPVSGQTTPSSSLGTAVDSLHNAFYSHEQSPTVNPPVHMAEPQAPPIPSNGHARAARCDCGEEHTSPHQDLSSDEPNDLFSVAAGCTAALNVSSLAAAPDSDGH